MQIISSVFIIVMKLKIVLIVSEGFGSEKLQINRKETFFEKLLCVLDFEIKGSSDKNVIIN